MDDNIKPSRILPQSTEALHTDSVLYEVLEALIDRHSMCAVLTTMAQVAFQRGSDWREASRMIQTTSNALPPVCRDARRGTA